MGRECGGPGRKGISYMAPKDKVHLRNSPGIPQLSLRPLHSAAECLTERLGGEPGAADGGGQLWEAEGWREGCMEPRPGSAVPHGEQCPCMLQPLAMGGDATMHCSHCMATGPHGE